MIRQSIELYLPTTLSFWSQLDTSWDESLNLRPLIVLAGIVMVAVLPVFLLYDGARSIYRVCWKGIPAKDYHYFYSSKIFTSYHEQLKKFIQSEVALDPSLGSLPLVQWIEQPIENREVHFQGVIERLRDLVRNKNTLPAATGEFVERFCRWVYTGPRILGAMREWMREQTSLINRAQLEGERNGSSIREMHATLASQSNFQGEIFQDYRAYDPRFLGDAPSHFFDAGATQVIRTPAVTRDGERTFLGRLRRAEVVEEFRGFLEGCRRAKERHLYVNLMAHHGSEKLRNEALESLEREMGDAFDLIHLSKDCDFYHQWGSFASIESASEFKRLFIEQMFGANPAYKWPLSWDLARTRELCLRAIEEVHARYFGSRDRLDRVERTDFIELAYTHIIESLLAAQKPASCNVSCRSCVDRGAANLALLYAKTQPVDGETLATIALTPALLAQSRPMLSFRMARLAPALDRLGAV